MMIMNTAYTSKVFLSVTLLFASLGVNSYADNSDLSMDAIRRQLEFNEQAICTYSGKMTHTQYVDVPIVHDDGLQSPYEQAQVYHVTQTSFFRDLTRGDDYFARIFHSSPLVEFHEPWFVERSCGAMIEGLVLGHESQPILGIIPEQRSARYVGEMPENFTALNHIYGLSSKFPKGYDLQSISAILKDNPEQVWMSEGREEINGQSTILLAVTYPYGEFARLSFVWLGADLNLAVVNTTARHSYI